MTYRISARAADDLLDILRHGVTHHGLAAAETYYAGLVEAFTFLAAYPRAARERREIVPPVRGHPYKSHLILYEIEGHDILVLRV